MKKENDLAFEYVFIIVGCAVYYFGHKGNFFESLGGLVGMALGSLFVAYLPYSFLKEKIPNALIKVFSVAFFLINLLVLVAS